MELSDSNFSYSEKYLDYLKRNYSDLSDGALAQVSGLLEATAWEEAESATDLNNIAVLSLVEAEQSEDEAVRDLYLNIALEALNAGAEAHPLCAVHLALLQGLIDDEQAAIRLAFSTLITALQPAFDPEQTAEPGLIYWPLQPFKQRGVDSQAAEQIITLKDGYLQAILLVAEILPHLQMVFYNATGLRFLQLAAHLLPQSAVINLRLGISSLMNAQREGVLYLHRAGEAAPHESHYVHALYLAYRGLGMAETARYWYDRAVELVSPARPQANWTELGFNHPITYVPFESDVAIAVEANFRSITTSVLMAEGDWFEREMEFWRHYLQPGMTVIDVGANVGVYAFSAAKRVGPTGRVIAIEPFSTCVNCLRATCDVNQFDWVTVIAGAASDTNGKALLQLSSASELNAVVTNPASSTPTQGTEAVDRFSLDTICDRESVQQVDFLKIDAEGHEVPVLQGSEAVLSRFAPVILYENIAGSSASNVAVAEFLTAKGYRLFRYRPYYKQLIPVQSADELRSQLNVIAVPPSRLSDFSIV